MGGAEKSVCWVLVGRTGLGRMWAWAGARADGKSLGREEGFGK